MKSLCVFILFVWGSQVVIAQPVHPSLDDDPVFHQVLAKRIEYPRYTMRYFPLYGRVYAGFHIDEKGKLTSITILSPGNTRSGFENEVRQALEHMPSLNPRYEGDSALPVAFNYINRQRSPTLYSPVNKIEEKYLTNRLVLKEWTCTFVFNPYKGVFADPREVWGYYSKK